MFEKLRWDQGIMGELKAIFPAVVAATTLGLNEDERKNISDFIRNNSDQFKKRARDNVLFEESPMNLHRHPVMEPMFRQIVKAVQAALKGIGLNPSYLNMHVTRSWANYNVRSAVTASHTHGNSHVSIVYYPDDSCNQAPLNFINTLKQHEWIPGITDQVYAKTGVYDQQNFFSSDFVSWTPEPDMCLLFPSSITHSVSPNPSDRPRISVAMDTLFTLKEYIRDEPLFPPPADWKEFEL